MIQNPAIQGGGEAETVKISLNVDNPDDKVRFYALGVDQDGSIVRIDYEFPNRGAFAVVKNTICVFASYWMGLRPPTAKVVGNAERVRENVGDPLSGGNLFVFRALGDCSIEFV